MNGGESPALTVSSGTGERNQMPFSPLVLTGSDIETSPGMFPPEAGSPAAALQSDLWGSDVGITSANWWDQASAYGSLQPSWFQQNKTLALVAGGILAFMLIAGGG